MVAQSFVDLVEQGKVAGKSLEELLHREVSQNTENICHENTNPGTGVFDPENEVCMTERSIQSNMLVGTDDSGTDPAMYSNLVITAL